MKYAVIAISGSQYKISEDQIITIDNLDIENGKSASTDQVLLVVDDKVTKIGTPLIKDAQVEYQIVSSYKGDKIDVNTFKAKSRYRRHLGFRPHLTDIKITKISY